MADGPCVQPPFLEPPPHKSVNSQLGTGNSWARSPGQGGKTLSPPSSSGPPHLPGWQVGTVSPCRPVWLLMTRPLPAAAHSMGREGVRERVREPLLLPAGTAEGGPVCDCGFCRVSCRERMAVRSPGPVWHLREHGRAISLPGPQIPVPRTGGPLN